MSNLESTKFFTQFSDIEHHQGFKKPRLSKVVSDSVTSQRRSNKWLHYKTQLCNNFKWGRCHYGEACRFAHGNEELKNTLGGSENEKGMFGRSEYVHHKVYDKLQLCRLFLNEGKCAYGESCHFRHVAPKRIRHDESVMVSSFGSKRSRIGCKRSLGLDVENDGVSGGRHFGQQSSVVAGSGLVMASGHFSHGNGVLRKLSGYTTVETKHMKTSTTSSKVHVRDGNFNWNELEKMSRIYADWIEEIPLVPRKVEC